MALYPRTHFLDKRTTLYLWSKNLNHFIYSIIEDYKHYTVPFFELNYQIFKINFNIPKLFQQHLIGHGMTFSTSIDNVRIMKKKMLK